MTHRTTWIVNLSPHRFHPHVLQPNTEQSSAPTRYESKSTSSVCGELSHSNPHQRYRPRKTLIGNNAGPGGLHLIGQVNKARVLSHSIPLGFCLRHVRS